MRFTHMKMMSAVGYSLLWVAGWFIASLCAFFLVGV